MRGLFNSVAMAFSMFCALPAPRVEWKAENMRYMLCALPLVGVVIGLAQWGWIWLSGVLGLGDILFAAGAALWPVAISGGIHMDGFCDTVDALSSHAEPTRKREILKDPHAGAFAVIGFGAYMLMYFALCSELERVPETALTLGLIHVSGRALGAFAGTLFPSSAKEGLLKTFRDASAKRAGVILALWLVACAAALSLLSPLRAAAMSVCAAICLIYVYFMSKKQFGGMSGDIAGFTIELCELIMLISYVIFEKAVRL